jgi:histidine phosphotransfer protein HptB
MAPASIVPETLERLADSFGGGTEGWDFVRELIETFLEDAPEQLAALRNAVEQGDAEEARRAAHTLKSNAATFGASALSEVCRELEAAAARGELDGATALVDQAEAEWERAREPLERAGPGGMG